MSPLGRRNGPPDVESGTRAGDLGLLQDGGAHAGRPPGRIRDALALAVVLGHLDELAASFCLLTARRAALFWLLAGGGAGLYLFAMDVLYDLQHGIWGKGANGLVELAINLVTLGLSLFVLRWAWVRRDVL